MTADQAGTFLVSLLLYIGFFLGIGIPWALALLPGEDWQDRATVLTLGLALGPLFGTLWLFVLGTWGSFDLPGVIIGPIVLGLAGLVAIRLRGRPSDVRPEHGAHGAQASAQLSGVSRLVIGLIAVGFIIHLLTTMFWTFIYYDTLWTYGYEPRVYLLNNRIPEWIEYYPKLVHLTYAFATFIAGQISDYAARAAIPWFIFTSIMMAYLVGWRLWRKRSIGILTAGLWFLTPAVFQWSFSGDLEHTVAIYFTGATIFFLLAWRSYHWRYAIIAGLMFGGALWTKPTAVSWALGVMLLVGVTAVTLLTPVDWNRLFGINTPPPDQPLRMFARKFQIAAVTGLVSIPIGGLWYLRNIAMGHDAVIMPPNYWNDLAQRSGMQFHWLLIIMTLAGGYGIHYAWQRMPQGMPGQRRSILQIGLGLALFYLGTIPSIINPNDTVINWVIGHYQPRGRLTLLEVILIVIGLALLVHQLYPLWRTSSANTRATTVQTVLIIAPFTIVWFFFYSYQSRLMFTLIPILAGFVAALMDHWLIPLTSQGQWRRRALYVGLTALGLVGPIALTGFNLRYIMQGVDTDEEKYAVLNPSLVAVANDIRAQAVTHGGDETLTMYTFNEHRLHFFFPQFSKVYHWDVPTRLEELDPSTRILIGGSKAEYVWQHVAGEYPNQISAYMQLGQVYAELPVRYGDDQVWQPPLMPFSDHEDFSHHLVAYTYHTNDDTPTDIQSAFIPPVMIPPAFIPPDHDWEGMRLVGVDLRDMQANSALLPDTDGTVHLPRGASVFLQLYWQRAAGDLDASAPVIVELLNQAGDSRLHQESSGIAGGVLPFSMLRANELIPDRWTLPLQIPAGLYTVQISYGVHSPITLPNLITVTDQLVTSD